MRLRLLKRNTHGLNGSFRRKHIADGFTLIELLVVIAIIAMLASIVLASLNSARAKARDATRVAELKQIANALELYSNTQGHYPNACATNCAGDNNFAPNWLGTGVLVSQYLPIFPADPGGATGNSGYRYCSDARGTGYTLAAYQETRASGSASMCYVDQGNPCGWTNLQVNTWMIGPC